MVNHEQVQRDKGEEHSVFNLGGADVIEGLLKETVGWSHSDFSLAELWRSPSG